MYKRSPNLETLKKYTPKKPADKFKTKLPFH